VNKNPVERTHITYRKLFVVLIIVTEKKRVANKYIRVVKLIEKRKGFLELLEK